MKTFVVVIIVATIIGGLVGGELTDRTFLLTGAVIGGLGTAMVVFGFGAFFAAQDEKRKRQRGNLPPEVRDVFARMLNGDLQRQAAASLAVPPVRADSSDSRGTFKKTAAGLIGTQLAPKFMDPKQAFGTLMTNKRAAGYIFGLHDALLQSLGLRENAGSARSLAQESYRAIFGSSAGDVLFSMSLNNQKDPEFHSGRMEGGEELANFVRKKAPPLGLNRILFLDATLARDSEEPAKSKPTSALGSFDRLLFDIQRVFRTAVPVPPDEDVVTRVLQRDAIYGAIIPFAYGLIVLKRATEEPSFIDSSEHRSLFESVENRMTKNKLEIATYIANGMPKLLDGVAFEPNQNAIRTKVQESLKGALNAVADQSTLRPLIVAKANLLHFYTDAAPFAAEIERKERLFEAMAEFSDHFLGRH